ncbi:hypothetical protein [Catellatospora paridis]|uniref:hypothetical protein n=1 Tax=Catellatospora paridis TaxID=1617086 RepID=UPI0012D49D4A|nr:hypothetical protein [Catellatospora paridis]
MGKPAVQATTEPTVRHPSGIGEAFTDRHQAVLDRLLAQESTARATSAITRIETQRRAMGPMARLLESDKQAKAARQELAAANEQLRAQQKMTWADDLPTEVAYDWREQARNLIPDVRPGINVFGLEYDYEVRADIHGHPDLTANRLDGHFGVSVVGHYGGGSDWGTAGVGKVLEATVTGTAHIRVPLHYGFEWSIDAGGGLDAFTHGSGRVVIQDHNTGNVLGPDGIRWKGFWHWKDDDDVSGSGSDIVVASELECSVSVHAGQIFHVTFLAHVNNSQSGEYVFSHSYADGALRMWAPFFVVEL